VLLNMFAAGGCTLNPTGEA